MNKIVKYFSKHVTYNSFVHLIAGIGIGALLTNSFFNPHPMRYGLILLGIAVVGHMYAYVQKK